MELIAAAILTMFLTLLIAIFFRVVHKSGSIVSGDDEKSILRSMSILFAAGVITPSIIAISNALGLFGEEPLSLTVPLILFAFAGIAAGIVSGSYLSFIILWGLKWTFNVKDDKERVHGTRPRYRFKRTR